MVQQSDYYVDDNETIYASVHLANATAGSSPGHNITFSLDDLTELSGQSTVFVNSIKFKVDMYNNSRDDVSDSVIFCLGGIVPEGTIASFNSGLARLEDYQAIKGWPLKGCFGYASLGRGSSNVANYTNVGMYQKVSWQKTYKPRKALLLSRLQVITLNASMVQNFSGEEATGLLSMDLQLKRGD